MNDDLSPISADSTLARHSSPQLHVQLISERVISVLGKTIYYYQRKNAPGVTIRGSECAMIVFEAGKADTFTLSYYPLGAEAQIVKELPMSALVGAHRDLAAAGFPHRLVAPPQAQPKDRSDALDQLAAESERLRLY